MRPFEIWIFLPTPDPPIHLTFMSATPPRLSLSAIRSLLAPTSLEMVKLSKMNKSQKVLLAYAALYAVYSLFWLGEMVGLQDAGLKFFGKRAGKIQVSAATWGGVGGLTLALDHVFAALKCSKDVAQRTVLVTLLGCFFRLGAFASQARSPHTGPRTTALAW